MQEEDLLIGMTPIRKLSCISYRSIYPISATWLSLVSSRELELELEPTDQLPSQTLLLSRRLVQFWLNLPYTFYLILLLYKVLCIIITPRACARGKAIRFVCRRLSARKSPDLEINGRHVSDT